MGTTLGKLIAAGALAGGLAACAAQEEGMADGDDPCGANQYAYLVGQSEADARAVQRSGQLRIYAQDEAVTMDYVPERLNIVLDERGGTVLEVKCG